MMRGVRHRYSRISGVVAIVIASLGSVGWLQASPSGAMLHRLAPPFHIGDLNGVIHHLADYRGKVLIVNFWASWCSPCRKELPSMNRAWAALKDDGVVMLAVNVGEDQQAVSEFVQDFPIDFTVLLDSYGNISKRWWVTAMPTTFVVDTRGHIVSSVTGSREWDKAEFLQAVRDLATRDEMSR